MPTEDQSQSRHGVFCRRTAPTYFRCWREAAIGSVHWPGSQSPHLRQARAHTAMPALGQKLPSAGVLYAPQAVIARVQAERPTRGRWQTVRYWGCPRPRGHLAMDPRRATHIPAGTPLRNTPPRLDTDRSSSCRCFAERPPAKTRTRKARSGRELTMPANLANTAGQSEREQSPRIGRRHVMGPGTPEAQPG